MLVRVGSSKDVAAGQMRVFDVAGTKVNVAAPSLPVGAGRGRESADRGVRRVKSDFKVGDHVTWNSEAGRVSGTVINVHTKDVNYKGYTQQRMNDHDHAQHQR